MNHETFTKALVGVVALTLVVSPLAMSGAASFSAQEEQDTETQTQQTSYLRVAHFSPDAPAVNVSLGNETVVSGAEFGNVTEYMSVPAGTHNVTITAEGQPSNVLFEGNVTVEPRMVATISASGEFTTDSDTEFQPVVFENDAWEPEDDMAAVSVVHLAPDAGPVDVVVVEGPEGENETETDAVGEATETEAEGEATETPAEGEETDAEGEETETPAEGEETDAESEATETDAEGEENDTEAVGEEADTMVANGTVLASGVTFQNASDYMNVPAGNYTLEIRSNETNETLATVELSVEGGNTYSAVAAGYANPDESPAGASFQLVPLQDATTTVSLPAAEEPAEENETEAPAEENETEAPGEETETPDEETETPGEETETEAPGEETETPGEETPTEEEPGEETPTATEAGA